MSEYLYMRPEYLNFHRERLPEPDNIDDIADIETEEGENIYHEPYDHHPIENRQKLIEKISRRKKKKRTGAIGEAIYASNVDTYKNNSRDTYGGINLSNENWARISNLDRVSITSKDFYHIAPSTTESTINKYNTQLLDAIEAHNILEVARLLEDDLADPNATCRATHVSACHLAILCNNTDALALLLQRGAKSTNTDIWGRTPLHLAAWKGNPRQMAMLLGFPKDLQDQISQEMTPATKESIAEYVLQADDITDQSILGLKSMSICYVGFYIDPLPNRWRDSMAHNCGSIGNKCPKLPDGWTALHAASSRGHVDCVELLLAVGSDPHQQDVIGRTPFDILGSAHYIGKKIFVSSFNNLIKTFRNANVAIHSNRSDKSRLNTPLHTAIELRSLESVVELINAGSTISCKNRDGKTPLHVCVKYRLKDFLQYFANFGNVMDFTDVDGYTVLHAAVKEGWMDGICVSLGGGASVTVKAHDGSTPIHTAVKQSNIIIIKKLIRTHLERGAHIDCYDAKGYTALYTAVMLNKVEATKLLLSCGASILNTSQNEHNIIHEASRQGNIEILELVLNYNEEMVVEYLINVTDQEGYTPIFYAVMKNHVDCVKMLLSKKASVNIASANYSTTLLHVAAAKNYVNVAQMIIDCDRATIFKLNWLGEQPLHRACRHSSRDIISVLLKNGADLSKNVEGDKSKTVISLMMDNLRKPALYLEELFDDCITSKHLKENNCHEMTAKYNILMGKNGDMKVIKAILRSGNRHDQKNLLVHPLLESFIYLKWKALAPFFYMILISYGCFVCVLSTYIVSHYFYLDNNQEKPSYFDSSVLKYLLYVTIGIISTQEVLHIRFKKVHYLVSFETWVRVLSIVLSLLLSILLTSKVSSAIDWPRLIATTALLLSWLELMFLLSRFPNWGFYVLMFGKVASKVIQILLAFGFLIVGFALCFMILFHAKDPFKGPMEALIKTVVMMTSEFEYDDIFQNIDKDKETGVLIVMRIFFVAFLVLASIVLMNLMVGIAVNDVNSLEKNGNLRRLEKQVEFLASLETYINKIFCKVLSKSINSLDEVINFRDNDPDSLPKLPMHIKEGLIDKAQARQRKKRRK